MRTYSELISLPTYEERYNYLKCNGQVGDMTFGFGRFLNQELYTSKQWRTFRNHIIVRDNSCDMAMEGFEIYGPITIHHLNIITIEDVENGNPLVFDPENVVCVSMKTHNAIHYGSYDQIKPMEFIERKPNDTIPWK